MLTEALENEIAGVGLMVGSERDDLEMGVGGWIHSIRLAFKLVSTYNGSPVVGGLTRLSSG
jgi:hypothetical protein